MKHEENMISAPETQAPIAPPRLHKPRREDEFAAEEVVTYASECDNGSTYDTSVT